MRWEELINFTPPCAFSTISAPLPAWDNNASFFFFLYFFSGMLPCSFLHLYSISLSATVNIFFLPSFSFKCTYCTQYIFNFSSVYLHLLFLSCFSFFSLYIGLFLLQYITVLHINKCFFMWSALFTLQYSSSLCNCFFYISFVLLLFLTITWLYFYFYFFWTFYLFLSAYVPFFSSKIHTFWRSNF